MNPTSANRPSILVVDDTPANLQLLVGMLHEHGYRVRPVTSGRHALTAVRSEPPDLILLDITMPEMDGYEVCRRLKEDPATREIPVLFLSALTETADKVKAFAAGGLDYVSKPFQIEEVAARVRTHLQLRRQQRELQDSLARERELERLRDNLTHLVVHDMRSPLLALSLTLEMVREKAGPAEVALIESARSGVASLVGMVNEMLDVSRLESGALPLKRETIELAALAREAVESLRLLAREMDVRVAADGPVPVSADRDLIRRVLANLVGNAIKFAPTRGHVQVRIGTADGAARVEVTDDGIGIAPEHHARIFEKFGQVEDGAKRRGTGLGLTFARMAVEAHGGRIGVISAPGRGSTFWFTLPRPAPPPPAPPS